MASYRAAMRSVNALRVASSLGSSLIRRGREMAKDQIKLTRGMVTEEEEGLGWARSSAVFRALALSLADNAGELVFDMVVVERGVTHVHNHC